VQELLAVFNHSLEITWPDIFDPRVDFVPKKDLEKKGQQ